MKNEIGHIPVVRWYGFLSSINCHDTAAASLTAGHNRYSFDHPTPWCPSDINVLRTTKDVGDQRYTAISWKEWTWWDLNPRLPACKTGILPGWITGPLISILYLFPFVLGQPSITKWSKMVFFILSTTATVSHTKFMICIDEQIHIRLIIETLCSRYDLILIVHVPRAIYSGSYIAPFIPTD